MADVSPCGAGRVGVTYQVSVSGCHTGAYERDIRREGRCQCVDGMPVRRRQRQGDREPDGLREGGQNQGGDGRCMHARERSRD